LKDDWFYIQRILPICTGFYGTEIKIQYNTKYNIIIISCSSIGRKKFGLEFNGVTKCANVQHARP